MGRAAYIVYKWARRACILTLAGWGLFLLVGEMGRTGTGVRGSLGPKSSPYCVLPHPPLFASSADDPSSSVLVSRADLARRDLPGFPSLRSPCVSCLASLPACTTDTELCSRPCADLRLRSFGALVVDISQLLDHSFFARNIHPIKRLAWLQPPPPARAYSFCRTGARNVAREAFWGLWISQNVERIHA